MPASNIPNRLRPDPRFHFEIVDHTGELADLSPIEAALQNVLQDFQVPRAVLSLAIVDDPAIHRVNREHLEHDWPTDVITFPGDDPLVPPGSAGPEEDPEEAGVFGEIILSLDTARRVAAELQTDWMGEVVLYAIHGTLHLLGLDDHSPEDRLEMRAAEQKYLVAAGFAWCEGHAEGRDGA